MHCIVGSTSIWILKVHGYTKSTRIFKCQWMVSGRFKLGSNFSLSLASDSRASTLHRQSPNPELTEDSSTKSFACQHILELRPASVIWFSGNIWIWNMTETYYFLNFHVLLLLHSKIFNYSNISTLHLLSEISFCQWCEMSASPAWKLLI